MDELLISFYSPFPWAEKMVYLIAMSRTYQPKKKKRRRTHGFLKRSRSSKAVLVKRRRKGRKKLSA